jgi:hypothetical protein
MTTPRVIRGGGLAAMAGGALWAALFAVYASRPEVPGSPYAPSRAYASPACCPC